MKYGDYVVQKKDDIEDDGFVTVPSTSIKDMVQEAYKVISPPDVWPEGRKDDAAKIRMDLIPPELLTAVGDILTFGAGKYGERNWERGMAWGRPYAAMLRHMLAWWGGEDTDPETDKSHLWHAGCCIAFLIAYEARGIGIDDRPKKDDIGT